MSQQVSRTGGRGVSLAGAIAGVVFCDFIGVLLFAVPMLGLPLGLATMFAGSPYVAWIALEAHPRRRDLTKKIGITNAITVITIAIALVSFVVWALSSMQWG